MALPTPVPAAGSTSRRTTGLLAVAAFAVLVAGLLWWSKWSPYTDRVLDLSASRTWSTGSVLDAAGIVPGSGPSLRAGWEFTLAYASAVWKALLAGLVIAAAVQTLLPRRWLLRLLSRRGDVASAAAGGVVSTPSMMCSCCTAPVANSLRRSGAPTAAVVAYWLGNPLLNPAVLLFLAFVAPWQWVVVRLVVGVLVVVGGSVAVARLSGSADRTATVPEVDRDVRPRRFLPVFARSTAVLVPEYLLVVFTVGAFSGWLFPLGESARSWGLLATLLAVVLGMLLVIPTAGEVPLTQGLAAAGFGPAVVGALLVVLPAVSLPSAVMVAPALRPRVVGWTLLVVAVGGLLAAGLLSALT